MIVSRMVRIRTSYLCLLHGRILLCFDTHLPALIVSQLAATRCRFCTGGRHVGRGTGRQRGLQWAGRHDWRLIRWLRLTRQHTWPQAVVWHDQWWRHRSMSCSERGCSRHVVRCWFHDHWSSRLIVESRKLVHWRY